MKIRASRANALPLTNNGSLSLFAVGTGSAFSKKLYQNNYLVVKGDDHLMIDCGTRTPEALAALGRPVTQIENWLITHSHADHIGGLEEVMLMGRYVARRKPRVIITAEYENVLWNHSLKGGSEYNESHEGAGLQFSDFWEIQRPEWLDGYPRETVHTTVGSIDVKAVRTKHFPEQARSWAESAYSVGLILDDRVFFTGDTRFDPELLESYDRLFNFEVIFHDVQFFTGGIHASLDELSMLPESMRKRMILMHYPDSFEEHRKRVKDEGFLGFVRQGAFHTFD
ncbi:MAG: MBL fold metallo-hydrolase [Spirochaetota bacterium]